MRFLYPAAWWWVGRCGHRHVANAIEQLVGNLRRAHRYEATRSQKNLPTFTQLCFAPPELVTIRIQARLVLLQNQATQP